LAYLEAKADMQELVEKIKEYRKEYGV